MKQEAAVQDFLVACDGKRDMVLTVLRGGLL
jgi:hypothetical protein